MTRTIVALALAATLAAPASRAAAQSSTRPVGIAAGVSVPLSDAFDERDNGGPRVESTIGYNLLATVGFAPAAFPLGLRFDLGYTRLGSDPATFDDFESSLRVSADVGVLSGTMNAVLRPTTTMVAKPYFIGGLGLYQVKQDIGFRGDGFGGEEVNETSTDVGFNVGAGLQFGLGGRSAFLEARFHRVMNDRDCGLDEACFSREATAFVPLSFGFTF